MRNNWGARLRAGCAVAVCSVALVACGGAGDGDGEGDAKDDEQSAEPREDLGGLLGGEPTPQESEEPDEPEETGSPDDGPTLRVLDHGAGPRTQAVATLVEGQTATSTMRMTMDTSVAGRDAPPIPMTMVMSLEVLEVTDERVSVRTVYDDASLDEAGLPPEMVTEIENGLEVLEGLAITVDQDVSGALIDTRFALPDDAPPAAHQMVEQIASSLSSYAVPFPVEPVGEGASWEVVTTVDASGITLDQTTVYVLEEFDGENYRISTEIDGSFEPVTMGGGARLVRGRVIGDGESTGALSEIMPASGTSQGTTTVVMKVGKRTVQTVTDLDVTLSTEQD